MENIELHGDSSNQADDQSTSDSDDERNKVNELFSSIRKGNLCTVTKLLEVGIKTDVIDKNNKDNTPLHYAVEKRRKKIVEELLLPKWKTDVNAKNSKGNTPLHIATLKGDKDLVKIILNSQAEINVKNYERKTPLDLTRDIEIANSLEKSYILSLSAKLFKKSDISEYSNSLLWAVTLAYLTAAKHDDNAFQKRFVKLFGDAESPQLIQQIRDLFLFHNPLANSLPICTDENLGRILIQKFRGRVLDETPSQWKTFEDRITFKDFLDIKSEEFFTCGRLQEMFCHEFTEEEIHEYGIDINDLKPEVFHHAALQTIENQLDKVPEQTKSQLFKIKAYFEATPLSCDTYFELRTISEMLGCNILVFTCVSKQPIKHVISDGSNDSIHLFGSGDGHFEFGLIKASELIEVIQSNQIRKAELYINIGIDDVNYKDKESWTPLHFAASRGLTDIIQLLLARGAQSDAKNRLEQNPLDVAKLFDRKSAVELLMKETKLSHCSQCDLKINASFAQPINDDSKLSAEQSPSNEQSKKNSEIFPKREGTSGMSGQLYEIYLCMLLLLQGLKKHGDGQIKGFRLAANVEGLDDFDDIYFEYNYKDEDGKQGVQKEKSKIIFLQAKHIENVEKKKITTDGLLSGSKANRFYKKFCLKNYFSSYCNIKQEFLKDQCHPIFSKQFQDDDHEFIIYTNASSEISENDNINKTEVDKTHILHLESTGHSNNYVVLNFNANENIISSLHRSSEIDSHQPDGLLSSFENAFTEKSEVREFLSKFQIFVDQPNEELLSEIIKEKMKSFYAVNQKDISSVFSDVRLKVEGWWKNSKYFLTEENRFFQDSFSVSILFHVKKPVNLFTGRFQDLFRLHDLIQSRDENVTSVSKITVISGMGGIGKTELARQYIQKYRHHYDDNIIWINAESEGSLTESFILLARDKLHIKTKNSDKEKHIKIILEEVYSFFSKRKSLFVFDNADKRKHLREFLPHCPTKHGQHEPYILITSQNQEWEHEVKVFPLNELNEEDATEFVKKGLGISSKDTTQNQEIMDLVRKLQFFPLAIQQAIAYIAEQKITKNFFVRNYLTEYEKRKREILDFEISSIVNDYAKTTFATWTIAVEKIRNEKYGEFALKFLNVLAHFKAENIKRSIFLDFANNDEGKVESAVRLLVKYSLVRAEQYQSILSIHTLVQEVTRLQLNESEKEEILMGTLKVMETRIDTDTVDHAISVFNHACKFNELMKKYAHISSAIIPELIHCVRYKEAYCFATDVLKLLHKFNCDSDYIFSGKLFTKHFIALILYKQGKLDESLTVCKDLYVIMKESFGQKHPFTLHTKACTAKILCSQGKLEEALQSYEEILDAGKDARVENQRQMLVVKHDVARIFIGQSKYDRALEISKEILIAEENMLGRNNFQTLETMDVIADVLVNTDKHGKALKIYKKLYKMKKSTFREVNSDVLEIRKKIAAVLTRQGKYKKGLALCKKILNTENKNFSEDRLNILCTKYITAEVLRRIGDNTKALRISEEVFRERKEILGVDHPRTLDAEQSVADTLTALGMHSEATKHYDNVLKQRITIFGRDHADVLTTLNCIGDLLLEQAKYEEALQILTEVYEKRKRLLSPLHIDTLTTKNNMAMALFRNGRCDEALELYKDMLNSCEAVFGKNHLHIFTTKNNLALVLSKKGEDQKALEILEHVFQEQENILGETHPSTLNTQTHLAALYLKLHKPNKALNYLNRMLNIHEKRKDYGSVLNTKCKIAQAYVEKGNYDEALNIYKNFLDEKVNIFGETHPEILFTRSNMGSIFSKLGKHKEALKIYRAVLQNLKKIFPSDHPEVTTTMAYIDEVLCAIGWTRLHLAAYDGDEAEITSFLDSGCDFNCRTKDGFKPLHLAVENNNKETVSALIWYLKRKHPQQLCSYVNDKTKTHKTALHMGAKNDNLVIIEILLMNGAYYDLQDKRRKFPLDLAKPGSDVQNILRCIDSLFKSVRNGNKDEVNALLESQSQMDTLKMILHARNRDEQTLTNVASKKGRKDIVEVLVNKLKYIHSTSTVVQC